MTIKNRDFLCVSIPNWGGDYAKTIVEIMSVIAKDNRVLYVDYQYTIKDFIFSIFLNKNFPFKRVLGLKKRVRLEKTREGNSVYVLTPPLIITNNFLPDGWLYEKIRIINSAIVRKSVNSAMKMLSFNKPITINAFNPIIGVSMLKWIELGSLIYYCYDEISAAKWLSKHGGKLEEELVKDVGVVINTSQSLYEKNLKLNSKSYLIKNGVDFYLFNKGFNIESIKNKTKIVGYIGSIDNRIDYDLISHAFESLKDTEFWFIGRIMSKNGESVLKKYNNVKILGSFSSTELPKLMSSLNVGIIPFVDNKFTKGIYPLKINEYLAAGLPVVMTNFGQLEEFNKIVSIIDTKEEFVEKLESVFNKTIEEDYYNNAQIAKSNSWKERVEELYRILNLSTK